MNPRAWELGSKEEPAGAGGPCAPLEGDSASPNLSSFLPACRDCLDPEEHKDGSLPKSIAKVERALWHLRGMPPEPRAPS